MTDDDLIRRGDVLALQDRFLGLVHVEKIADLPAQGVTQDAHEKAVMAEKMRMMDWCGKRVGVIQRAWKRAAEKAMKGDLGDLRNRVDMMDAPPLDVVQSADLTPQPAPDVAGLVEAATSLLSAVDAYADTPPQSSAEALASCDVATAAEAVRAALAAMDGKV